MLGLIKKNLARRREEENWAFRDKYARFKEILERNSEVLETISLLSEVRDQGIWINLGRLRALLTQTAVNVYRLIENLNAITDQRYQVLEEIFTELGRKISRTLDVSPRIELKVLSLPLEEVGLSLAGEVGPKAARLGEMTRLEGMAVPRGVAFTAHAYQRFVEYQGLKDRINKETLYIEPGDPAKLERLSRRLQELILEAELPPELEAELEAAWRRLQDGSPAPTPVVLRSSAVGEDQAGSSFAGLYRTVLNPPAGGLARAYKEVVASKFSSQALTYLLQKGYYHELCPMGVILMELVPARVGGVMFTRDSRRRPEAMLASAVWGLGKAAVDGSVSPDLYWLERGAGGRLLESRISLKTTRIEPGPPGEGLRTRPVAKELREAPCLDEGQLAALARAGLALEERFGAPQDLEWLFDHRGELRLVQSRPLQMDGEAHDWRDLYPWEKVERGPEPLASEMQVGSPGAACGKVVRVRRPSEVSELPRGVVAAVKNTSPELVSLLPRAGAILAERGNTSGHLAIIAREFSVPLLIGLPDELLPRLESLERVTVDAFTGSLFPGRVEALLELSSRLRREQEATPPTPVQHLLDEVTRYVTPLNLVNPRDPSFRPQSIRTIHDIIRFAHETAINTMFELNDSHLMRRGRVVRLKSPVPLDVYLIDLGGGLAPGHRGRTATPEQITSIPMRALYRGMTTPGVRWAGPIPIDFKGFVSVFANTLFDGSKHERRLGDRSYAIISRHYLNFSSRLGYHFSIVDAFLGRAQNDNYISFRFKGGAAELAKRVRRVQFIQEVLERHGFWVDQKADLVNARLKRLGRAELEEKLVMLGRLMGCSRQLDVTMHSEEMVRHYVELFMNGDYSMGHGDGEAAT